VCVFFLGVHFLERCSVELNKPKPGELFFLPPCVRLGSASCCAPASRLGNDKVLPDMHTQTGGFFL